LSTPHSRVTGLATVFPGEEDAPAILQEAFQLGLSGVKLHSHVQCFNMESDAMHEVYRMCEENRKPLVIHAGREHKSPAYHCDPYVLCSAEKLERVLRDHPGLRVCVPHLGADEFSAYGKLIETYDTLWLDTTMMMADYLPHTPTMPLRALRPDRVMYGTDFPNIPYAWDRELKRFCELGLPEETASLVLGKNAMEFFGISALGTNERGS
jgi:predicted TIM-barrel fold metal-dependent hydrolase